MLRFEDFLEERLKDEVLKYMLQNGYKSPNTLSPEFRAINDTYKQAYLAYNYGDSIAEKLRNNNATLYDGQFTRDTVNELLANEWNSKAGIETAKMVKANPVNGLNPNQQILNTVGEHLVNNKLITTPDKARRLEEFDSVFQPVNNMKQQNSPILEGGIEKNVISTPHENGKSKPVIEEYPEGMQPGDKVLKAGIEKNVSAYDLIQEDKNLSTEEKVDKIHEVADKRNQEIEKEHRKKMSKNYLDAAWQFVSPFIPAIGPLGKIANGATKVLSPVGKKLAPIWGKQITEKTINGFSGGLATSPLDIAEDVAVNNKEVLPSVGENILKDSLLGGLNGFGLGKLNKKIMGKHLHNMTNINKLPNRQQRKLQDKATQYYDDYLEGTSVRTKDGGSIKFEKLKDKISPEKANTIPDLPKQIKRGKIESQNDLNNILGNSLDTKNVSEAELEEWLKRLLRSHKFHI